MLYEYAVDPNLLSEFSNCHLIFANFELERGKLIAAVPRDWKHEASEAIKRMERGPIERKKLQVKLEAFRGVCPNRPWIPHEWDKQNETWLEHVKSSQGYQPFAAILTSETSDAKVKTYKLDDLLIEPPDVWNAVTSCDVPRKAKEIIDELMPLLRISKDITLIDPYLDPGKPYYRRVLRELMKRLWECNFKNGVRKLTLHLSNHLDNGYLKSELQKLIEDFPGEYKFVCRISSKDNMHDRFALTDIGGISLTIGFDEAREGRPQSVFMQLLDYSKCKKLRSEYDKYEQEFQITN